MKGRNLLLFSTMEPGKGAGNGVPELICITHCFDHGRRDRQAIRIRAAFLFPGSLVMGLKACHRSIPAHLPAGFPFHLKTAMAKSLMR